MSETARTLVPCPCLIDGEWIELNEVATSLVHNPSTGAVIAEAPMGGEALIDEAAKAALPGWCETPPVERARVFFRYRMLLEENFESICALISREHGKTLSESRGEVQRGIENVEYACSIPELLMGQTLENIAHGIDGEIIRQPLGICAGITPFNFPVMVPMWMFPLALACGNTFILKPSEKVPLSITRAIELLQDAGLPQGF